MQNINSLTEKIPTARERMKFQTRTVYLTIILRGLAGYQMIDNQRGA